MSSESLNGILITGSSGQVGGELVRAFTPLAQRFGSVHAPLRADLNLSDPDSIRRAVRTLRPRWILNPAAYTAVDRAESEPELAYQINAEAVRVLGEEAARLGSAVVHFSTDYVFDGTCDRPYTEQDATSPINLYGASKLTGEQALADSGAAHIILRTSWVYSASGHNFLRTVLRYARERSQMTIVNDQHGSPTWSRELAHVALAIVQRCEAGRSAHVPEQKVRAFEGVYHATCAGETTWFGFARQALNLARVRNPNADFAELVPVNTSDYPTLASRPVNSLLNSEKLAATFGIRTMHWEAALAQVIEEFELLA